MEAFQHNAGAIKKGRPNRSIGADLTKRRKRIAPPAVSPWTRVQGGPKILFVCRFGQEPNAEEPKVEASRRQRLPGDPDTQTPNS
jgi:hypothetical protein